MVRKGNSISENFTAAKYPGNFKLVDCVDCIYPIDPDIPERVISIRISELEDDNKTKCSYSMS
jgi:hypothetical protein